MPLPPRQCCFDLAVAFAIAGALRFVPLVMAVRTGNALHIEGGCAVFRGHRHTAGVAQAMLALRKAVADRHTLIKDETFAVPFAFFLRDGLQIFQYRSEEHTSELKTLMRHSYAVFCLKKKKTKNKNKT